MSQKISSLILLILICLGSLSCRPVTKAELTRDEIPRVVILSAFDAELGQLLSRTDNKQELALNGRKVTTGRLAGQEVVLFTSGVSMVNAAMMTQKVLDVFTVKAIIISGIAGGVNPDLHIGDVTIPARWAQYQEQVFAREKDGTWDPGRYGSPFGNFGMMFPQPVGVTRQNGRVDDVENVFWFEVDEGMLEAARKAAAEVQLEDCPFLGKCLEHDPSVVVGGNGVSGPTFVDNAEYRAWIWETFQADAVDMETAAVAHVAFANEVPFIAFRSLSDLAGGGAGANELLTFFRLAANNSAAVVEAFLTAWE